MARHPNNDVERTTTGTKAKRGAGFALTSVLVLLHILLFASLLIFCAIVFNSWANGGVATSMFTDVSAVATLLFSFLAGAVGLATMIMAAIHGGAWNEGSRYSSLGANLITFALVALAFGFACKCAHNKPYSGLGGIGNLMICIIAWDIFLGLGMLLYLAHLGLFKHDRYDDRYGNTTSGYNGTATTTTTNTHPGTVPKHFTAGHEERAIAA